MENTQLKQIIEAALMVAGQPLNLGQLAALFPDEEQPDKADLRTALEELAEDCEQRGIEISEVASGYRFQVKQPVYPYIARMWEEKPQRYSRALLETLALIAYRQPITRGEIEEVRGVSVSTNIIRTLEERDWIRAVGHRDVPGKPALYGTTRAFLDYFNLKSLDQLPSLAELKDIDELEPELDFGDKIAANEGTASEGTANGDAAGAEGTEGAAAASIDAESINESVAGADEGESVDPQPVQETQQEKEPRKEPKEDTKEQEATKEQDTHHSQSTAVADAQDADSTPLPDSDEHLAADLDAMLAQVDNVLHSNQPGTAAAAPAAHDTPQYSEITGEENDTGSQAGHDNDTAGDAATDDSAVTEDGTAADTGNNNHTDTPESETRHG